MSPKSRSNPKTYRSLTLNVYAEDSKKPEVFQIIPDKIGTVFTLAGIEYKKTQFAEMLRNQFPDRYFQFIRIKPNRYNVKPIKTA